VGNGIGLSINHIGSAHISCPSCSFILKNLLHVPSIYKNLLSVSKFAHDNFVFFEFYSSFFVIKDCRTKSILHQGPLKHGLYQQLPSLTNSTSPTALLGERTSTEQWHKCLGHPALRTVKHVISKFSLPVSSNKSAASCASCQQAKAHQLPFPTSSSIFARPLELLFSNVWVLPPLFHQMEINIMLHLLMLSANSLGYFLFNANLMFSQFSINFFLWLNVYSILKFNKFKQIGVGNFILSTTFFINLASFIVCLVLTHINIKVVSNANIAILSIQHLLLLLKVMFPNLSGMRLAKLHAISLIDFLHQLCKTSLLFKNFLIAVPITSF